MRRRGSGRNFPEKRFNWNKRSRWHSALPTSPYHDGLVDVVLIDPVERDEVVDERLFLGVVEGATDPADVAPLGVGADLVHDLRR